MMYFERKAYLKELISAEGNGMIKIITGIRRCGKSFLLFNIFCKHLLERGVAEAGLYCGCGFGGELQAR